MSGGILSGTGDWGVAGNWSSGLIPVSNDNAQIPNSFTNDIVDPTGAASGVDLDLLLVHNGYQGNFGSTGAPIRTASDKVRFSGAGDFFYESHKAGASNLITDLIVIDPTNPSSNIELGSDAGADAGQITDIRIYAGSATLKTNIVYGASTVVETGTDSRGRGPTVLVPTGGPVIPKYVHSGGQSFIDSEVTELIVTGGTVTKDKTKAVKIELLGGTLVYNHKAIAGDVTYIIVHAGATLNLMGNVDLKVLDRVVTMPGSLVVWSSDLHTITFEHDDTSK